MKKIITIFCITVLLILVFVEFLFIIRYKKQTENLKTQISILNGFNSDKIIRKSNNGYKTDIILENCLDGKYITSDINECTNIALIALNKEYDNLSKELIKKIGQDNAKLYNASQHAWENYYNKEKEFLNKTINEEDGDIHSTFVISDFYELKKQRVLFLKAYLSQLEN